jgi:hypothetical protein
MKEYKKAKVLAQNLPTGSYAAGCPVNERGGHYSCHKCERTQ